MSKPKMKLQQALSIAVLLLDFEMEGSRENNKSWYREVAEAAKQLNQWKQSLESEEKGMDNEPHTSFRGLLVEMTIQELNAQFPLLASNIMADDSIADKSAALDSLVKEYSELVTEAFAQLDQKAAKKAAPPASKAGYYFKNPPASISRDDEARRAISQNGGYTNGRT
jgi:hypothetical protein